MGITTAPTTTTTRSLSEFASTGIHLLRRVIYSEADNQIHTSFPVLIDYSRIEYSLDAEDKRTGIIKEESRGSFTLSDAQIYSMWTTPVTHDGVDTTLGELIASQVDALIAERETPVQP